MRYTNVSELVTSLGGSSYEAAYLGYISFFEGLASASTRHSCELVPECWAPLVRWLGHDVLTTANRFGEVDDILWMSAYDNATDKRRILEISSACRPELVHALYLADTRWPCPLRHATTRRDVVPVTNNASFFADEITAFRRMVIEWVDTSNFMNWSSTVIFVPCAATKPYPAPMHTAVRAAVGNAPDICVVSGVIGVAPEQLWAKMPNYDSGLPNLWRAMEAVEWYLSTKKAYSRAIIYSDFYAPAIEAGIARVTEARRPLVKNLFPGTGILDTYANLMSPENIMRLQAALGGAW